MSKIVVTEFLSLESADRVQAHPRAIRDGHEREPASRDLVRAGRGSVVVFRARQMKPSECPL